MIVVDTSIWVATLRGTDEADSATLTSLLDADEVVLALPVRWELSAGVSRSDRHALKRALSALPVVVPTEDTWRTVERWIERAANAGERFGIADLIVAALAHELGALVWSLDTDFQRMAKLRFVQLYA